MPSRWHKGTKKHVLFVGIPAAPHDSQPVSDRLSSRGDGGSNRAGAARSRPRHGARLALAVGGVAFATSLPAMAHPHVFIDYGVTILCDADHVTGARIAWTFDEMYSASLYHDYTNRPLGPLSRSDIDQLERKAFQFTSDRNYFLDIRRNGTPQQVKKVTDFDASYDGGRMTYRFTVPLESGGKPGAMVIEIASFDTEFYIDFELVKRAPVKIEHGDKLGIACAPKKITKATTTFGPMQTTIVQCSYGEVS